MIVGHCYFFCEGDWKAPKQNALCEHVEFPVSLSASWRPMKWLGVWEVGRTRANLQAVG